MGFHDHHETCYLSENHPLCRLHRIHELEVKVQTLETQLQYERTGHLTEVFVYAPTVAPLEVIAERLGVPCHDHIEPPIVSGGPTWASHQDDPPSLTP